MTAIALNVIPKLNYSGCEWQIAYDAIELVKKFEVEVSIQLSPYHWIFVDKWSHISDIENKVRAMREAIAYPHVTG